MKYVAELSLRLLRGQRLSKIGLTTWISLAGLSLGVACLVVSMAVVSGFERTLQRSVSDITGHLQVLKLQDHKSDEDLAAKIKSVTPEFKAATRFLMVEAVAANKGLLTGALLQGVDPETMQDVLSLKTRLREGQFRLGEVDGSNYVLIGKGLAKKFDLHIGDDFHVVVPLISELDPNSFRRNVGVFKVAGILDLGKFDFNERLILASISSTQKLADVGNRDSGLLVRLNNFQDAREVGQNLSQILGPSYRVRDWKELNENIFEAVKIERVVIFFVILIIVLAAAFNVSSSLYVAVVQRYPEIAILKAMGMGPRRLIQTFCLQGVLLGFAGCLVGLALGGIMCLGFSWAESMFQLLPGSVYKLDYIELDIRVLDVVTIVGVTLIICALATLAPARQGSRLTAVEGLRYG